MGEITREELYKILQNQTTNNLLEIISNLRYKWDKENIIKDILSFDNQTLAEGLWAVMRWKFEIK